VTLNINHRMGTRPDQAHSSPYYVAELWQFIHAIAAKDSPYARDAWIGCNLEGRTFAFVVLPQPLFPSIRIYHPSAKLAAREAPAFSACTGRPVECGPARIQLDRQRDERDQRRGYY